MNNKRIIVKLSGASLSNKSDCIIDSSFINNIAKQLIKISKNYQIGVVIGGGNIWRGNLGKELSMNPNVADSMGMMATIMNSIALENTIINNGGNAKVFNSLNIDGICDVFNYKKVDEFLNSSKGNIAIFSGGTGSPFFTTDSAASLRACQINCKKIFMGKHGVDGVYDKDPKTNKNAVYFESLTYKDVLNKNLKVMDLTAVAMCEANDIELIVFNIDKEDALVNVVDKKIKYTTVKK